MKPAPLAPGAVLHCEACGAIYDYHPVWTGSRWLEYTLQEMQETGCHMYPCKSKRLVLVEEKNP